MSVISGNTLPALAAILGTLSVFIKPPFVIDASISFAVEPGNNNNEFFFDLSS